MNILTDALPATVSVGGREYEINTDFRAGVKFEMMIEQGVTNAFELVAPFFLGGVPRDIMGAFEAVERFYCCGVLPEKAEKSEKGKQAYSFGTDANAIFSDFWRYYTIDLSREYLHWWAFRALLMGLPDESRFKQRAYYRTCDLNGVSKKERDRIMRIRSEIEIKTGDKMTLEERNASMLEHIAKRRAEATGGGKNE